jgi:hypothetical protein
MTSLKIKFTYTIREKGRGMLCVKILYINNLRNIKMQYDPYEHLSHLLEASC